MLVVRHFVGNWKNPQCWIKPGQVQEIHQSGGSAPQFFGKIFNDWFYIPGTWYFLLITTFKYGTPGSIVVESCLFLSFYSPGIFLAIKSKWTMPIVHHLVDNWRNLQWWMKQGWVQEIRQIGRSVPRLFVKIFNEGFFTSGIFIDII